MVAPGMRRRLFVVALAVASTAAALGFAQAARTDASQLTAVSGTNDGYDITVSDSNGAIVKHLDPGTYTLLVHDRSGEHNFRLAGPGVDKATSVLATGDFTWTVALTDGYYRYLCDPHPTMHGDFTVGTGKRPLVAFVGPGRTLSLRDAFNLKVREVVSDHYVVTVKDRSKTDNFRLRGPGVNKATGVAFRGTTRWNLTLTDGVYTFSSDAHKSLRRTIRVTGPPVWGT
jgi:plastocyanin